MSPRSSCLLLGICSALLAGGMAPALAAPAPAPAPPTVTAARPDTPTKSSPNATVADRVYYYSGRYPYTLTRGPQGAAFQVRPTDNTTWFVQDQRDLMVLYPGSDSPVTVATAPPGTYIEAFAMDPTSTSYVGTVKVYRDDNSAAIMTNSGKSGEFVVQAELANRGVTYGMAINPADGKPYFLGRGGVEYLWSSKDKAYLVPKYGNGTPGFSGDGGAATKAQVNNPQGLAFDEQGNLYLADSGNNRIRYVDAKTGIIDTIAGNGVRGFSGDGEEGVNASLNQPTGVALDRAGNVYLADQGNNRIRLLDRYRTITTLAGNGLTDDLTVGQPAPFTSTSQPSRVGVLSDGAVVFDAAPTDRDSRSWLLQANSLTTIDVAVNALPKDLSAKRTSALLTPRGSTERASSQFDIAPFTVKVDEDGSRYLGGEHTLFSQKKGAPFTLTAASTEFWVTSPLGISNLLLLHDVTVSHEVAGQTYTANLDQVSLAYQRGFGWTYIATTPPKEHPWGDLVIGDLRNASGDLDPQNAQLSGAWVLKAGFALQPHYSAPRPG